MLSTPKKIGRLTAVCIGISMLLFAGAAQAHKKRNACTSSASLGFRACKYDVKDDLFEAFAKCVNESDVEDQAACYGEALEERHESREECRDVRAARVELCEALGPDPYDPDFDPANFQNDFAKPAPQNGYWPLGIGYTWTYAGGDEEISVEVKDETKRIEGVTCIVVTDEAKEDDVVLENTDDWLALGNDGSIHYCGEISRNFEVFEGDDPDDPELVEVEGSWKAGRDGAKSGVLLPTDPAVGQTYRQEWAHGDAEDAAEVISTTYGYGGGGGLDENVPEELAELFCDDDCLVTRDFSPLEPGVDEYKYYAPGIGLFLEVDPESGEILQLTHCSFDARCDDLPEPEEEEEDDEEEDGGD